MSYLRQPSPEGASSMMAKEQASIAPTAELVSKIHEQTEDIAKDVPRSDVLTISNRVFEHSAEDGLKLSERLRMTPDELLEACASREFAIKHPQIFRSILNFARAHEKDLKPEQVEKLEHAEDQADKNVTTLTLKLKREKSRKVLKQYEDAYKELIKSRKIKERDRLPSGQTSGERMADNFLAEVDLALQNSYYAAPLLDKLEKPPKDAKPKVVEKWKEFLKEQQIITGEEMDKLCKELKLDSDKLKKDLEKSRYMMYREIFSIKKTVTTKELKKELTDMIRDDQEVKLDRKSNKYEVVDKERVEEEDEERGPQVVERKKISLWNDLWNDSKVTEPAIIKGKLFFTMRIPGTRTMVYDEDLLRPSRAYDSKIYSTTSPVEAGGRLWFLGKKEELGRNYIYDANGRQLGESYDDVKSPTDVNGVLHFVATDGKKQFIANTKGEEFGKGYDEVDELTEINGQLYFKAVKDHKVFVTNAQGKEYGTEYDYAFSPEGVNGVLHFRALKDGKSIIANEKGQEFGKGYEDVHSPTEVDGELFFVAYQNNKYFITNTREEKFGEEFVEMQPPLNDNGRLVIVGKKKDGNWEKVTIDLGKEKKKPKVTEMKPNWDGLFFTAVSVGGELFFEVGGEDKYVIINEQGKVISKDYDSASTPFDVNGELYFTAEKDGKKFITNLKGERFFASNPYPCSIVEVNGKKYFEFLAL
ncbi:MAG: hypothetical protein ABII13_02545, partial [Patescibacteria group bacterium]